MAWSPDGKRLLTGTVAYAGDPPNPLRVWSETGQPVKTCVLAKKRGELFDGLVHQIIFRTQNEVILICQWGGQRWVAKLNLVDGAIQEVCRTPEMFHWGGIGAIAPDGKLGALADGPGRTVVGLFKVQPKAVLRYLAGERVEPAAVGWGVKGDRLARNLRDPHKLDTVLDLKALKLSNVAAADRFTLPVTKRDGWSLEVSEGFLRILQGGKLVAHTPVQTAATRSFTLPPQGEVRWVAWATGGQFTLHDPLTGKELRRFKGAGGIIQAIAASPDGKYLLAGDDSQVLRIYAPRSNTHC